MRRTASRSPSLPIMRRHTRSKSNFLSNRSDSEPTMCPSLYSTCKRQPSIVLTKASIEKSDNWNGSIGSRLPSHLSLGSSNIHTAPTSPLSMFFSDKYFPPNRSVTPLLFPEHHHCSSSNSHCGSTQLSTTSYSQPRLFKTHSQNIEHTMMRDSLVNITLTQPSPPPVLSRSPSFQRRPGVWGSSKQTDL